ncbi:hypothetical protein K474DRAFT_1663536, partial [Panus rudis PR-1116 ss-1]
MGIAWNTTGLLVSGPLLVIVKCVCHALFGQLTLSSYLYRSLQLNRVPLAISTYVSSASRKRPSPQGLIRIIKWRAIIQVQETYTC